MSELWKEIEEDIRSENTDRLWRNFGKAMVRVSIAVLVGTVGGVMWNNHKESTGMERTAQFIQGTQKVGAQDYKGGIAALGAVDGSLESAHGAMAALVKAHAENTLGQTDVSKKTYESLAKTSSNSSNEAFVSLAMLSSAEQGKTSAAPESDTAFHFALTEQRAWQLLSEGKKDEAVAELSKLKNDMTAPRSLRMRASSAVAYLSPPVAAKDEAKHD